MKPKHNPYFRRLITGSLLAIAFAGSSAFAQSTQVWIEGETGAIDDSTKYVSGIAPVDGDTVTSDGVGSVIGFSSASTVNSLAALNLNLTSGATIFNHASGTLSLGTLGFGGGGGTRNPTYNMNGGQLDIAGTFSWSNGTNANFNLMAGTVNHTATGFFSVGGGGGSRGYLNISGGTFNSSSQNIRFGGSASNGIGYLNLSGDGIFNANATGTFFLANNSGSGHITMDDDSQLNIPSQTFAIGQFGSGTASLTMNGGTLTAPEVILGGANASSSVTATVSLYGGTVSTTNIRKGASSNNTLILDGGTVQATAATANFFTGLTPTLDLNGLTFDTNGYDVNITPALTGSGGLTKIGDGFLTFTGTNSYTGDTTIVGGTLTLTGETLADTSIVSIAAGGSLELLHNGQDEVAEIILDGVSTTTPGTYGSSSSPAIFQNDSLFQGTGVLRIGPASAGLDLTWTGSIDEYWESNGSENFTTNGVDAVPFTYNDSVTFDDSSAVTDVFISGVLFPTAVHFEGTQNYTLTAVGSPSGISGSTGIVMDNTGTVSLGGTDSSFTGPISVNAGTLVALDNKSFGASSGITIATGAQVNINGKSPGAIYTYNLNGPGPGGTGAIVNTAATDVFSGGGVKHLVLNADSTIGSDGGRFDVGGGGGTITGNGHTLTKVGGNSMAFRGTMDPINDSIEIVVAGGFIWAEGSATAFGGEAGFLTIQSGAAAGTFGSSLTIATPVSIESGGTLRSGSFGATSANTGTWTGGIDLAGEVTLHALGGPLALTGSILGTANVTKTGGNEVLIAAPTYTGNTTVEAGTLTLESADLDDAGDIIIESGAVLNLTHSDTDVVDTLLIGNTPATPGTWGSTSSTAANTDDTFFQGTGVLDVQNLAVAPSGYGVWAESFSLTGDDALADADPDHDGIENAVERLIGGDPTIPSQEGLPTGAINGGDFVLTFNREDESETADTLVEVQYGNDLVGWTDVTIGETSAGIVTVEENDAAPDLITVNIPTNGDPSVFARVKVTVTAD
jgi:autotransporter-associated beta strand protein